jgi:DNA polymerase III sliding clamp (beta) subunit (PCNA family)
MSMGKTLPRSEAVKVFSKSSGYRKRSFRPYQNLIARRSLRFVQKDLRDGLRKTSYAISTDETRYVLNGLLFSLKDNKLTLVATDGRRLAMVDIELEFPRSHEVDIIVPTKAVTELQRLLTDDGDVKVSIGSGQIAFDLNNTFWFQSLSKAIIRITDKSYQAKRRNVSLSSAKRFLILAARFVARQR